MNAFVTLIKTRLEELLNVKIYRYSIPHGTALLADLRRRFDPDTFKIVFDVGANVGQTAESFVKQFPRADIYSCEPVPTTYSLLVENTRNFPTIRTFQVAFGSRQTRLRMNIDSDSRQNSFVATFGSDPVDDRSAVWVDVVTLDIFAANRHLTKIDFLKIDAEGFDLEVLKGAVGLLDSESIDFVQVETGFDPSTSHVKLSEFTAFLDAYGYSLFGIYEQQPFWSGEPWLMYANAVFARRGLWKA